MNRNIEMSWIAPPEGGEPATETKPEVAAGFSPGEFETKWQEEESRWRITDLLDKHHWGGRVEEVVRPEGIGQWPEASRKAYLETVGRFFASMDPFTWAWTSLPFTREKSESEYRRLVASLADVEADKAEPLLRLGAMLSAHQKDTNVSGDLWHFNRPYLERAADKLGEEGRAREREALLNPFRLEAGTALFHFNDRERRIAKMQVMDFDLGAAIVGEEGKEPEIYDLHDLNSLLSRGQLMTPDGDCGFGGRRMLEAELAPFTAGAEIDLDMSNPLSRDEKHEAFTVVGSNRRGLEDKYGEAWLMFALRHQGIYRVDIRRDATGQVAEGLEFHDLRLYRPKPVASPESGQE
jgi:hypothetical protein